MAHASSEPTRQETAAKWARMAARNQALCDELKKTLDEPSDFSCGDGWFPHVEAALRAISKIDIQWEIAQIKQKCWELRMYIHMPNLEWRKDHPDHAKAVQLQSIVAATEATCSALCESCGEPRGGRRPVCGPALCFPCGEQERIKFERVPF